MENTEQPQQGEGLDVMALFESVVASAKGLEHLLGQMKVAVPCAQIQYARVDAQSIGQHIGDLIANGPQPMKAEVPLEQSEMPEEVLPVPTFNHDEIPF